MGWIAGLQDVEDTWNCSDHFSTALHYITIEIDNDIREPISEQRRQSKARDLNSCMLVLEPCQDVKKLRFGIGFYYCRAGLSARKKHYNTERYSKVKFAACRHAI